MASVFLSYDREDAGKARPIALALEKAGHGVWWDLHVRGGAQFSKVIEEALKAADAVVVLWSAQSVESPWVRDEAAAGRDSGRLVPVSLDATEPPIGFRQFQTIDLSGWRGRGRVPRLDELLASVEELGGSAGAAAAPPITAAPAAEPTIPLRPLLMGAFVLAMILAGLFAWRPWSRDASPPVVSVAAADSSPAAKELARDLLAKLGNLQATQTDSLKLVEGGDSGKAAEFAFEVAGARQGQSASANLVLLAGKDRALLWSKAFETPLATQADLRQQLAFTAAKVLDCAVEAVTSEGVKIRQDTLKLYLRGCSAFSETASADPRALVPVFREVVAKAPRFEDAWAKLLHAELEVVASEDWTDEAAKIEPILRSHMADARKLNPDMAELLLAEAELTAPSKYGRRMELLQRAVERNPESAEAAVAYSNYLSRVGRGTDAIEHARRAVQLDPLSPFTRDALISALTYTGQTDRALEELRKAEELWPGASNLFAARYRLHLRYGDPHEARRLERAGRYGGPHREAFLDARINPSPANIDRAISYPRRWFREEPRAIAELAQVLGAFGREEELFPILLNWQHPDNVDYIADVIFRPALRNFRRDPRMIRVAHRIGLLDFWRTSRKWPDFCFEPDLPYDCKEEAARLAA